MGLVDEINKLKARHFLFGLIGFLGTLGPGFLLLYHYHPELVEKYDIWKLILFAAALTLPFFFAGLLAFIMATAKSAQEGPNPGFDMGVVYAGSGSTLLLNASVALAYFYHCSFRQVMAGALIVVAVAMAACLACAVFRKRPKAPPEGPKPNA